MAVENETRSIPLAFLVILMTIITAIGSKLGSSSIKGHILRTHHAEYSQCHFNLNRNANAAELCHPMGRINNNPLQMVVLGDVHDAFVTTSQSDLYASSKQVLLHS